ncbi:MAG: hypothetical protein WCH04_02935, partial [Gammaproteobacteria bacterium]
LRASPVRSPLTPTAQVMLTMSLFSEVRIAICQWPIVVCQQFLKGPEQVFAQLGAFYASVHGEMPDASAKSPS